MLPQRTEVNGSDDFVPGFAGAEQDRCEAMQFAYRVTFDSVGIDKLVNGDPGPEGVHQDDAVLTVREWVGLSGTASGLVDFSFAQGFCNAITFFVS